VTHEDWTAAFAVDGYVWGQVTDAAGEVLALSNAVFSR
jgi:hypothetical protein